MASVKETRDHAISMAEHYEREAQSLTDQYGTGVRPSWVSTDLAIANQRAAGYRKLADSLQGDDDDECKPTPES